MFDSQSCGASRVITEDACSPLPVLKLDTAIGLYVSNNSRRTDDGTHRQRMDDDDMMDDGTDRQRTTTATKGWTRRDRRTEDGRRQRDGPRDGQRTDADDGDG